VGWSELAHLATFLLPDDRFVAMDVRQYMIPRQDTGRLATGTGHSTGFGAATGNFVACLSPSCLATGLIDAGVLPRWTQGVRSHPAAKLLFLSTVRSIL
jgi:hypothetical protein